MGTSVTIYTQNTGDAQKCWSSSYNTTIPTVFGNKNGTDNHTVYRVYPSISQSLQRVVVDSGVSTIRAYSSSGSNTFTAPVNVVNDSCPDLSAGAVGFTYTPMGSDVNVSIPTHTTGSEISATTTALIQAWFDRAAYAQTDYLGTVWEAGDSAKNEYWEGYSGNYSTASYRSRIALTYHICSKAKPHGKSNALIKNVHGVLRNNIGKFSGR